MNTQPGLAPASELEEPLAHGRGRVALVRAGAAWISRATSAALGSRLGRKHVRVRQDLSRRLEEFTAAFAACHGQMEAEFVESSRALRALYSAAETLANLVSERLAAMRDALGESRIGGPDGIAAGALRDLQGGFTEASQELLMLQSVTAQLHRFRMQVEEIHRVGKFARLSVFLFAVESARTADCQELFGAFVSELRALGDRITGVAQTIDAAASQTQHAQEIECQARSVSHAELSELAKKLETTASATAAGAQVLLDDSLNALKEAGAHMRQITKQAGEAVFYMQFGDIVRQKTEHIAAALHDSAAQLAAAISEVEFRTQAGSVDHMLAIQIRQLELIRSEVDAARQKLGAAFESLGTETGELKEMLHRWRQDSAGQPGATDALKAFKADLGLMEKLHQHGHELRLSARRAAQSVSAASSRLAVHVEQVKVINMDVHLQALNAIVKAAALGENGVTLSVLSMHVDWLYRESNAAVTEVVTTLQAILKAANQNSPSESPGEGCSGRPALNAGMNRIVSAYDDFRKTSGSADELVAKQQAALSNGRASLDFLARHLPAIEQQIQGLVSFRQLLAPWIETTGVVADASVESLHERYTMHSEREVHANLHRAGAAVPAPLAAPAENDGLEIFKTPPATGVDPVETPLRQSSGDRSEAPGEAAVKAPEMPVSSDNVEFF